jgi:hypothetical protein
MELNALLSDSASRSTNGTINSGYLDSLHERVRDLQQRVFPRDAGYLVMQAWITYRRQAESDATNLCPDSPETDSKAQWATEDSLQFYPQVEFYGKPVLYLTAKYELALDGFLDYRKHDDARERLAFLQPEIAISIPFGPDLAYLTYPALWDVAFSADLTKAWISFGSSAWSDGWACCSKSDGRWSLEFSDIQRIY